MLAILQNRMVSSVLQELDEFSFHHRIADTSGVALVFFTGPDCSSCHHLRNLFASESEQFHKHLDEFIAYEIKADKSTALVNEFGVFHLPSMFLYNDGVYHCELHAQALPHEIITAIKLAVNKPAEEEP